MCCVGGENHADSLVKNLSSTKDFFKESYLYAFKHILCCIRGVLDLEKLNVYRE